MAFSSQVGDSLPQSLPSGPIHWNAEAISLRTKNEINSNPQPTLGVVGLTE